MKQKMLENKDTQVFQLKEIHHYLESNKSIAKDMLANYKTNE